MAKKRFYPHTMEITRQLDISGVDDKEAERLRKDLFTPDSEDAIVARAVGTTTTEPVWVRIVWKKFRQWLRNLPPSGPVQELEAAGPTKTEEVTTRYLVEPEDGDK
jgi:hypothetical protein